MPDVQHPQQGRADFPTTAQLLISGGDARIRPDPVSGLNKYGCKPYPDAELLAFGSSTASTISQAAFAAVDHLRDRLAMDADTEEQICTREMRRIRQELLELAQVSDLGAELVFAASGTDAHALAAQCAADGRPISVVMVDEVETGSGVAAALSALDLRCSMLPLRHADGAVRPIADVDAEASERVSRAVMMGERVLLVMVDQSKTGLIAPSPACVMQLHQRYPEQVVVLVDACQFRIAPPTLRVYLQQGFMVALTGSKFFTGPSFSAALLLPESLYFKPVHEPQSLGLLLRWEAALVEMRRFCAVPQDEVVRCLETFAREIQSRLMSDSHFDPLPVPAMDRKSLPCAQSWDHIQSIFPFLLYRTEGGRRIPLARSDTLKIYHQLQQDLSCDAGLVTSAGINASLRGQLGQPVACGMREGVAVSALRLCISARQISNVLDQGGIDDLIADALAVFDKAVWLADLSHQDDVAAGRYSGTDLNHAFLFGCAADDTAR